MSSKVRVTGLVEVLPPNPSSGDGLSASIEISASRIYASQESGSIDVSALLSEPLPIQPGGVAQIRVLALRAVDRTAMVAVVSSSSGGAGQAFPFSDVLYLHSPPPGDPILSVAVAGTGRVEYVVAGDDAIGGGGSPLQRDGWFRAATRAAISATDASLYVSGETFFRCDENSGSYELVTRGTDPDDGTVFLVATISGLQWRLF